MDMTLLVTRGCFDDRTEDACSYESRECDAYPFFTLSV